MKKKLYPTHVAFGITILVIAGCSGNALAPLSIQPSLAPATQPVPSQVLSVTNTPPQVVLPTASPVPSATRTTPLQVAPILPPSPLTRTPTPRDGIAPRSPAQVAPIGGVVLDCGRVTLNWKLAQAAGGIRDYDVDLERLVNRSFVDDKTWNNILGDYIVFDPNCNAEYRWRIRSTDNSGNQGTWSDYQGFVVKAVR